MVAEVIPGFTVEQSWAIERVIERAVQRGVSAGLANYETSHCAGHEARTERLEHVVLGNPEDKLPGLDERVAALEKVMVALTANIQWYQRAVVGAIIVAVVGLIITLVQAAILGG